MTLLAEVPATQTSFADSHSSLLSRYYYTVTAINPGEGPPSNQVCARGYVPVQALTCLT